jgi:hypothetical protein
LVHPTPLYYLRCYFFWWVYLHLEIILNSNMGYLWVVLWLDIIDTLRHYYLHKYWMILYLMSINVYCFTLIYIDLPWFNHLTIITHLHTFIQLIECHNVPYYPFYRATNYPFLFLKNIVLICNIDINYLI